MFSVSLGLLLTMTLGSTAVFTQATASNKAAVTEVSIQATPPSIGIVKPVPDPKPRPGPTAKPGPTPLAFSCT